jgi:hypothetical protein
VKLPRLADSGADGFDGAGVNLSQQMLELGEDLLNRVQVSGKYFGRKNSLAPPSE